MGPARSVFVRVVVVVRGAPVKAGMRKQVRRKWR
jgi:hypothetical protein